MKLTQGKLKEVLDYDPDTGVFMWKVKRSNFCNIDRAAGSTRQDGYKTVFLYGKAYKAHRLAWFYVYGYFPETCIDHINGDNGDNRIENLREVGLSCNSQNSNIQKNNKTGFIGVHWCKKAKKYYSTIRVGGKLNHLGTFSHPLEAALLRVEWQESNPEIWSCDARRINETLVAGAIREMTEMVARVG